MKFRKFTIAGGNTTALAWGVAGEKRTRVAKELLNQAEQAGFMDEKPDRLSMMGGELCVNAALAAAYALGGDGTIKILENKEVLYRVENSRVTIKFQLDYEIASPKLVLFGDIGYIFARVDGGKLQALARQYKLPAFGCIIRDGTSIQPTVYVKKTSSIIDETACGSGSIAASLLFGIKDVVQPTGQIIKVAAAQNEFVISAQVEELMYD